MITVLDFYATWCHPCKKLDPKIEELKLMYPNINFLKIEIEEQKELCEEYNITAVPTVIIINENKEISKAPEKSGVFIFNIFPLSLCYGISFRR